MKDYCPKSHSNGNDLFWAKTNVWLKEEEEMLHRHERSCSDEAPNYVPRSFAFFFLVVAMFFQIKIFIVSNGWTVETQVTLIIWFSHFTIKRKSNHYWSLKPIRYKEYWTKVSAPVLIWVNLLMKWQGFFFSRKWQYTPIIKAIESHHDVQIFDCWCYGQVWELIPTPIVGLLGKAKIDFPS